MPQTIITRHEASAKNLLGNADSLVWIGKVQWVFAGRYRWLA